jgi:hypothetical protein
VELPKRMFRGKACVPVGTPGVFNYLFFRVREVGVGGKCLEGGQSREELLTAFSVV